MCTNDREYNLHVSIKCAIFIIGNATSLWTLMSVGGLGGNLPFDVHCPYQSPCSFPNRFVLHLVRILVMNTDKIPELPRRVVVQTRLVPILKLSDAQGAHMPQLDVLGSKKGLFLN